MEESGPKASNPKRCRKPYILTNQKSIAELIGILKKYAQIPLEELANLLKISSSILTSQSNVLKISSSVIVVGDIHGQFYDLISIFQKFGYPPQKSYLFMGDYVDRGYFCIQVMVLLLSLKIRYPGHIFLLRGNHEGQLMTTTFNFRLQCVKKYNYHIYECFLGLFMKLPLCAVVKNKHFIVHGGISPSLRNIQQIQRVNRFEQIKQQSGFLDLLWSDPVDEEGDWTFNKSRRCSYFFTPIQSQEFLTKNNLKLIIRGHQVTERGFKYQKKANESPLTLTIFSAPNYCDTYRNKAAVAFISEDSIDIKHFSKSEHPFVLENYMNTFDITLPILSKHITSIFKTVYKIAGVNKNVKRSTIQKRQDNTNLHAIQNIQSFFSNNVASLMTDVVNNMLKNEKVQNQIDEPDNTNFNQQWLLRFINQKLTDQCEKFPCVFGPRSIIFVKMTKKLQEIKIQQEEINDQ